MQTLLLESSNIPASVLQLVPATPSFVGFCDASATGCGGCWLSFQKPFHPIIWQIKWPADIEKAWITAANKQGTLCINAMETAGILAHVLILEQVTNLQGDHIATWCDNSSAVSWICRLTSSKSKIGQRLVWTIMLRLIANRTSPLITMHIPGIINNVADFALHSFADPDTLTASDFLSLANLKFLLSQGALWQIAQLSPKTTTLLFSKLRNKPPPMELWWQLSKKGHAIGMRGLHSANPILWIPASTTLNQAPGLTTSWPLPSLYAEGASVEEVALGTKQYTLRYKPLVRPSNWMHNPTHAARTDIPNNIGES